MKPFDIEHNEKVATGFKIPENYFEQFEAKMMAQLPVEKEVKVISIFHKKQLWMSSIAALVLLAIAIPVYFNMANETKLDASTIENYLAKQHTITNNELINHLTDDDIKELETSLGVTVANTDGIESYLSETQNLDYILNE
ncbi:hypothetical protein ACFSX9_03200 [Flavobacterium ardleyense]|uniref:Uncharacterized protein n=1 Tax=Flavobacterium ardleyense TaxID=2038737 RepID=A0ABW5Z4N8_9FLAO